jgi:hypothetical protein
MRSRRAASSQVPEPHVPSGRLSDGSWLFAPVGSMLVVAGGERVVCHACGAALAAVSAGHLRGHGLGVVGYRVRFGLNRKASLLAPALAAVRRAEGRRRWEGNEALRAGLAVGQAMARSGVLYELGAGAQPVGSRRVQGRVAASAAGASAALRAHREGRSVAARARWEVRVRDLGFGGLEEYVAARVASGASAHRVRTELGCGGSVAAALLVGGRAGPS